MATPTTPTPPPAPPAQPAQPTQDDAAKKAEALTKAHDEAVKAMTDYEVASRVRAVHLHAATSEEGIKAMREDYDRLVAEKTKASETATKPMGTAG